jgi:hypothetical protein
MIIQEVAVQGQDKVYKDVIEPLESVSVNSIPTSKEDIRDLGPPDKVYSSLFRKLATLFWLFSFLTPAVHCAGC